MISSLLNQPMLIYEQKRKVAKPGIDLTNLFSYNLLFNCENAKGKAENKTMQTVLKTVYLTKAKMDVFRLKLGRFRIFDR